MAPPIVLIHGFATSSARTWGETGWLDILGDSGREIVALDVPGHGDTPHQRDPEGFTTLERDLLDQFPPGLVDAIGFSMGARILLTLASEHPERFNRLVVAGVGRNLFEFDEQRKAAIMAAVGGELDQTDPQARYFHSLAESGDVDRQSLVAMMQAHRPVVDETSLAKISCPVLVVIGDSDFAGPATQLVNSLNKAEHKILRNTDHFATPKSYGFIEAAIDFLEVFA